MTLNGKQMTALVKMMKLIMAADGVIEEAEIKYLGLELARFNVPASHLEGLLALSDAMEFSEAISIISSLDNTHKNYVTAALGAMIAADGDVDDAEIKIWSLVSALCNLPEMSIKQAAAMIMTM